MKPKLCFCDKNHPGIYTLFIVYENGKNTNVTSVEQTYGIDLVNDYASIKCDNGELINCSYIKTINLIYNNDKSHSVEFFDEDGKMKQTVVSDPIEMIKLESLAKNNLCFKA